MTSRPTNWVNCCSRCRVELRWVQLSWVDLSCVAINTINGSFISWKFDDAIAVVVLQWCNKHHSKQERPKQYLTGWWRGRQRIGRSIQRLGTAPLSLIYNNPPRQTICIFTWSSAVTEMSRDATLRDVTSVSLKISRSLKVIRNYTVDYAVRKFLVVVHCNCVSLFHTEYLRNDTR